MKITIETVNYFADLRARMQEAHISGNQLAIAAGVDATQLSRWMSGKLDPRLSSIEKLESAIAVLQEEKLSAA